VAGRRSRAQASRPWAWFGAGLAAAAILQPGTAHAALGRAGQAGLVRELVAHTGHRVFAAVGRQLSDLVDGLLAGLWGETMGHAGNRACAGLAVWDLIALCLVAALVFAVVRVRNQTSRKRLEVARRMVEQGMEPPGDLLGDTTAGDLRRGIVLLFTGLGLLAASWFSGPAGHGPPSAAGFIPGFIGLGYLVSHWLSRGEEPQLRRAGRAESPEPRAGPAGWSARDDGGDP